MKKFFKCQRQYGEFSFKLLKKLLLKSTTHERTTEHGVPKHNWNIYSKTLVSKTLREYTEGGGQEDYKCQIIKALLRDAVLYK